MYLGCLRFRSILRVWVLLYFILLAVFSSPLLRLPSLLMKADCYCTSQFNINVHTPFFANIFNTDIEHRTNCSTIVFTSALPHIVATHSILNTLQSQ